MFRGTMVSICTEFHRFSPLLRICLDSRLHRDPKTVIYLFIVGVSIEHREVEKESLVGAAIRSAAPSLSRQ
jgi:hypothetical protein